MTNENNPYDALVQQDTAERARVSMMDAVNKSPDVEVKLQGLAKQYGMPVDAVRLRQPEIETQAKIDALDYDSLAKNYPKTAGKLADPGFSSIAHDDVETMTQIERKYRQLAGGVAEGAGMLVSGAGVGLDIFQRNVMGAMADMLPTPRGGAMTPGARQSVIGPLVGSDWRFAGGAVKDFARNEVMIPAASQTFGDKVAGGLGQLGAQIPASMLLGPAPLYLQGLDAMDEKVGKDNASQGAKDLATLGGAAITGITEKWALDKLLGPMATPMKNAIAAGLARIGIGAAAEGGQEFSENLLQDILRQQVTNPDATIQVGQSLEEGGVGAAVGGIVRSIVEAGLHVKTRGMRDEQRVSEAEQHAQALQEVAQLAEASKVRQRSPETFAQFAQSLVEESVPNLYIDANALMQSANFQAIAQAVPSVAEQIEEAAATGGDVVIPTQEFLSAVPGSEFAQDLIENARTSPEAMSQAEARVFMQERGTQLQTQIEDAVAAQQENETWKQGRDQLQADFAEQLNAAKRFTPDANAQYASMMANFYAVTASKLNTTPQELAQRYGLRVQAQEVKGGQRLDQGDNANMPESAKPGPNGEQRTGVDQGNAGTALFDTNGLPNRGSDLIKSKAEELAGMLEAQGFQVDLQHSGSVAGPSSYLRIYDPQTGRFLVRDVRLSGHSKGVFNSGGVWNVTDAQFPDVISAVQEMRSLGPSEMFKGIGEQEAKAIRIRLASADKKIAKGKPLTKSEQEAVDARAKAQSDQSAPASQGAMPSTIEVDGKQRPTTNSKGQPIAATEEGVRNFWRWFGDSKVVDAEGKPLVVYHGTTSEFDSFDLGRSGSVGEDFGRAIFFTSDTGVAASYTARWSMSPEFAVAREAEDKALSAWGKAAVAHGKDSPEAKAAEAAKEVAAATRRQIADQIDTMQRPIEGANIAPSYMALQSPLVVDGNGDYFFKIYRKAFETAQAGGHDGIIFRSVIDSANVVNQRPADVFVAFRPEQVKSSTGNNGEFDPANPSILRQEARGSINLPDDITQAPSIISLFKGADLSTFIHESGHFFLEVQMDLAARIQAQINGGASVSDGERGIVDDANKILAWFGVKGSEGVEPLTEWFSMDLGAKRPMHEQWARGFEAYAFEGNAPSIELQGVFQKFRTWLVSIYKNLKALNVELTDDVRGVMDRMLASEQAIEEAQAARAMGPLFKTAEDAGMTPEEFAAYHAMGGQATQEAIDYLQARGLRDMKWLDNAKNRKLKELQKQVAEMRREVRTQVRGEVMQQPVYRAWQFLTGRPDPQGEDVAMYGKLDAKELDARYGEAGWQKLADLKMTRKTGGLPSDIVAEANGFGSGDEMVKAIMEAEPPKVVIEALTDQRMLERFGDIGTPEGLQRAVDMAIHNEARARFVATEIRTLERGSSVRSGAGRSTVDVLTSVAKAHARRVIGGTKVRDLKPGRYTAAEARAAKAAEKAMVSGKAEEALTQKRNQLINLQMAKATMDARDESDKAVRYLRKFSDKPKSLDADYYDQIASLLDRYDLANVTLKSVDKRKSLAAWVESQREQGMEPDIPPELLDESRRQSYKELTFDELQGLRDTVRQIENLGRLKNTLLTAKMNRDFQAVRDVIADSVARNANGRSADTRTPATVLGRRLMAVKNFGAAHIKAATWARVFDGGDDGGPMWEYFIRPANEAANMETTMRAEATQKLHAILSPVIKAGRMDGKGQFFPSINRSMNREQVFSMALNMGNEGNIQRMLDGEGWSVQQIQPVVATLSSEDWKAVQAIWDHFESYRPLIGAKERRIYGKEPQWVEPVPLSIQASDGQMVQLRGGYYPVKYDPLANNRAEQHSDAEDAKRQMQAAYTSATTRRGFTKSRVEAVRGRPLLYSLAGIYSNNNDVIHDLAFHEWLIDVNKLLRSDKINDTIRETYGPAAVKQLKTWIEDTARGEQGLQAEMDTMLGRLRQGVSIAGLGFNVMSAAIQPIGITQSVVRIGGKWVGRGVSQYLSDPIGKAREVNEKSEFMASRARTRFRELNELRNQVEGEHPVRTWMSNAAFYMMTRMQMTVDIPTWLGAYEKAMSEGNTDERASALADQAVIDAQGGGQMKDLSAIERGGPAQKLFTVFYSFFNTSLNLGVGKTMTEKSKAKLAADYLLLYSVPAVLTVMLKDALTPGDSGDWDDLDEVLRKLMEAQLDQLFGLMVGVREVAGAAKMALGLSEYAKDYQGPAGLRLISDITGLAIQVNQGEVDDAFRKRAINVIGSGFGLPAAQINRTFSGAQALIGGETANPAALAFGFQEP